MEVINPDERCLYCFSADISVKTQVCQSCFKKSQLIHRMAAAFDDQGPAFDLLREFKNGKYYLAKSLASSLVLQWYALDWPFPDCIVPVPSTFSRWFQRGCNPRALLAKELGKLLRCSVSYALKRTSYQTDAPQFRLRSSTALGDRTVLLVDDLYVTGRTLRSAAETLRGASPQRIYGLTFSRAMR